ncbi:LysR substrate-binding domain-containing protein [Bdellovibrio bacteriovorus]|uniref:LysR family transcriptional regulator n=1 Tax=Bdellovibrio bacteriovorus TaxID=959 RepID=UPI0035A5838F
MDLNEIAIFVKVVQAGSFSAAAKQLEMPNSTVSAKISSLEKRLGVTLLHRTTRKLQITQAGQLFFERCQIGIDEIKAATDEVTQGQGEPQGLLKVTAPAIIGASLLKDVIAEFRRQYPKIQLELLLTDRRVDLISEGIDLAIRAGELKDSSLIAKKLGLSYFAPFASPTYLKKNGTPLHPKDLREHQCLQFTPLGKDHWEFLNKSRNKITVNLPGNLVIDDLNMIKDLALAGEGIALLPTFLCGPESKNKKLVRILPEWRSDLRPVSFVYPPQRFPQPRLQAFITCTSELLKERLKELEL